MRVRASSHVVALLSPAMKDSGGGVVALYGETVPHDCPADRHRAAAVVCSLLAVRCHCSLFAAC